LQQVARSVEGNGATGCTQRIRLLVAENVKSIFGTFLIFLIHTTYVEFVANYKKCSFKKTQEQH